MSDSPHPIAGSRALIVTYPDGKTRTFEIQVSAPFHTSDGDYCCEMRTEDVLFAGTQKVFGVDAIDAFDYAIQYIDAAAVNFQSGDLRWPDGASYKRVPSTSKLGWG